jgi:GTPase SAR1 family protein
MEKPQLVIHEKIYEKLHYFHESKKIPHIIFHGSSGSGKRTIVNNFINTIYNSDKSKIKSNVMFVNCAHGKGIRFIREDLKFFAKTNIQANNGVIFKTIVLLNADFLTIDAQSALRRCIELFSYNTRFFIIVENKNKLLNPILSRFCEIYVSDQSIDENLHQYTINRNYTVTYAVDTNQWISDKLNAVMETYKKGRLNHRNLMELSTEFYENGLSTLDLLEWLKTAKPNHINDLDIATVLMCFDKIKSEYRCEKMLLLYMFDFLFLRSNKDLKCITNM